MGGDDRYAALVRQLALADPQWTLGLLRRLRTEAQMRTASLVGAEFVRARTTAGESGYSRQVVEAVLQRPDEPGELLAYWTSRYGRRLPQPVKRGVADAVRRLYTGRALLKYDTASRRHRFGDVLELTHPAPAPDRPWQGELFRYALDRRHRPDRAVPPTDDLQAVTRHYREHDRVVVVTDEQAARAYGGDALGAVPGHVPVYTWNLAGYAMGHGADGPHRHTFGGLSDAAFRLIPLLEAGQGAGRPWE